MGDLKSLAEVVEGLSRAAMALPGDTPSYVRGYLVDAHARLAALAALGEGMETTAEERATLLHPAHEFEPAKPAEWARNACRDIARLTLIAAEANARAEAAEKERDRLKAEFLDALAAEGIIT